jgi:hypothetical protein
MYLEKQKRYGPDKLRWEEAEAEEVEEKIRLKQFRSPFVRRGDIIIGHWILYMYHMWFLIFRILYVNWWPIYFIGWGIQ